MDLGQRFKKARTGKGYFQREVAEHFNVSRQASSKWETGITYPDVDKFLELSRY